MRSPARFFIQLLLIIVFLYVSTEMYAASAPPDPGGDPTGGDPPVGGGAPIGNGTFILIAAALAYASYKMKILWQHKTGLEE